MNVGNLLERARELLVTIPASARLTEAAARLGDERARRLVVCHSEEHMAGVVGPTDIVARFSQWSGSTCTEAVAAAMARPAPRPNPNDKDWFDMASKADLQEVVRAEFERLFRDEKGAPSIGNARIEDPDGGTTYTLARYLKSILTAVKKEK